MSLHLLLSDSPTQYKASSLQISQSVENWALEALVLLETHVSYLRLFLSNVRNRIFQFPFGHENLEESQTRVVLYSAEMKTSQPDNMIY